jgi:hypothetical protein
MNQEMSIIDNIDHDLAWFIIEVIGVSTDYKRLKVAICSDDICSTNVFSCKDALPNYSIAWIMSRSAI